MPDKPVAKTKLSVIIPALNEASHIATTLSLLQPMRRRGVEIILVDGGSEDNTIQRAKNQVDKILTGRRGRARQMNLGAQAASGEVLWFVHADTSVPDVADQYIQQAITTSQYCWGRFDIRLSGSASFLKVVASLINLRSRLTAIATGDQGIFVSKSTFEQLGGFSDQELMEDIELSRQLKKISRPICLRYRLVTSSRRWENNGIIRTILLMWTLRFLYALGVNARTLARWYR